MRSFIILSLAMIAGGCAMTVTQPPAPSATLAVPPLQGAEGHTFASAEIIGKLIPGVSREEALALIGRTAVTGYELKDGLEYKPVTVANPYRSQKITKGSDVFEVDYYLTEIRKADGTVSDDELTPLVFKDNKLIGKGWEFLKEKIK